MSDYILYDDQGDLQSAKEIVMTTRLIESVECEDKDGHRYEVHTYQNFKTFSPLKGPRQEVPGIKDLRLADGSDVNCIDENTFKIVATDTIVTRV